MNDQQLQSMRYRAQYGLPLDMDEQRWLVEQVTGPLPPQIKRCKVCDGTGFERIKDGVYCCLNCSGDGYIRA